MEYLKLSYLDINVIINRKKNEKLMLHSSKRDIK